MYLIQDPTLWSKVKVRPIMSLDSKYQVVIIGGGHAAVEAALAAARRENATDTRSEPGIKNPYKDARA